MHKSVLNRKHSESTRLKTLEAALYQCKALIVKNIYKRCWFKVSTHF